MRRCLTVLCFRLWLLVAPTIACDTDYYASVDLALSGSELRAALRSRVESPHSVVPYVRRANYF